MPWSQFGSAASHFASAAGIRLIPRDKLTSLLHLLRYLLRLRPLFGGGDYEIKLFDRLTK